MSAPLLLLFLSLKQNPLTTVAEKSGWTETGRYDEIIRLCGSFQRAYPRKVRCQQFGITPEGRPMLSLVASSDGVLRPRDAAKKRRPVVLMQGGIHAGEIDGKDAGLWLLRDLLDGKISPGTLSRVTLVFVPVFNIDGHERFGPYNRCNQVGPREMGWRVTAQNLNLNRDYTKADAPEMVAMLRLLNQWDPIMYLDLHVTDGAKFEHDVAVMIEPMHPGPEALRYAARRAREILFPQLEALGHLPLDFYPAFVKEDEPSSGFAVGVAPPRFSHGYWSTRNRLGVLVETHSWKDYATRVRATRDATDGLLRIASSEGTQWLDLARAADQADRQGPEPEIALAYQPTGKTVTFSFRGYAYTREASDVSGGLWTKYDTSKPQIWQVPLLSEVRPSFTAKLPAGGYLVPAAHAGWLGEKLRLHGFSFTVLKQARAGLEVETFRANEVSFRPETFEGHAQPAVKGEWKPEKRDLPAGSLYVPAAQPGRRLLAHLLEPASPDSFLSWGFFNGQLEQKEGMDAFVAEQLAREMLQKDPKLKAEFDKKLAEEPDFGRDASARLNFFYRRSPWWDERYRLYPVYRVQAPVAP
jgi:hypothetical protein